MKSVGVGEFKKSAGNVLQRVRVAQETIEITWHGRAIARLVPIASAKAGPEKLTKIWSDLDHLSKEIGARWPKGVSAVGAAREQRR